jgi:hypothetical protein
VTRTGRAGRSLVAVVMVVAAYGWLDLLRHLPGPHLSLVLPLRGNGGGDDISLLTVVLVCVATFAAIARLVPTVHVVRAAVARAVLFGGFVIAAVALQQGFVEQSRPTFEWTSATWLVWPWLGVACAAFGTWLGAPHVQPEPLVHTLDEIKDDTQLPDARPLEASIA